MTNLKPRIRLIDLNELEEHRKSFKTADAVIGFIIGQNADPFKTKDLLSEVFDCIDCHCVEGYCNTREKITEHINNLIL